MILINLTEDTDYNIEIRIDYSAVNVRSKVLASQQSNSTTIKQQCPLVYNNCTAHYER